MKRENTSNLDAQKQKMWKEYHALRLEDEKRLAAKFNQDCLANLEIARQDAVSHCGGR